MGIYCKISQQRSLYILSNKASEITSLLHIWILCHSDVTIQRFCHDTISRYCNYPQYDTPRYRPSMKQQIIWYHRQCVCVCVCVVFKNSRRKISSRCVLIIKHVRMTLDKCLSNVYPSPNLTFSHNTKTKQHSCKEDS